MNLSLDELNLLVTEAIRRAEALEDLESPKVKSAWAEVSLIEEQLVLRQSAESAGGGFARRGAVSAAFKSGDFERVAILTERLSDENAV